MSRTDQIVHAETRALLSYWERLRAGRIAPFRIEVDPRNMSCEARRLFIVELLQSGEQRFRIAGSEIVDTFGMPLRGQSTRVIMEGKARDSLVALIAETLAEPGIGYARVRPAGVPSDELWEMLFLPLRSDGGAIDRMIGILRQIVGRTRTVPRLMPLRLTLEEMWIQPTRVTAPDDAPQNRAAAVGALSELRTPARSRLTTIEGGLREPNASMASSPAPRPALRLVKSD